MDDATLFRAVFRAVGGAVILLGIALTGGGLRSRRRTRRFESAAARVNGVITGYQLVDPSEGDYSPIVRFRTAAGEELQFQSIRRVSRPGPVGSTVSVAYDPFRPARAELVGAEPISAALIAGPVVVAMGLVFILAAQLAE